MNSILIADDEAPVRRLVARLLSRPGREVLGAADGLEALSLAAERAPDLILPDVRMPWRSGLEVLEELRARSATRLTPVILHTASSELDSKAGGLSLGADDFIPMCGLEEAPHAPYRLACRFDEFAATLPGPARRPTLFIGIVTPGRRPLASCAAAAAAASGVKACLKADEVAAGPGQILAGSEAAVQFDGRFALSAERALRLDGMRVPVLASEFLA